MESRSTLLRASNKTAERDGQVEQKSAKEKVSYWNPEFAGHLGDRRQLAVARHVITRDLVRPYGILPLSFHKIVLHS